MPPYPGRQSLPIIDNGNLTFRQDMEWCLDVLRAYAPHRYREVVENLPKAEYDPNNPRFQNGKTIAISSGHFKWTSKDDWRGREGVLLTLLHEVRHCLPGGLSAENPGVDVEKLCDDYAHMVFAEVQEVPKEPIPTLPPAPVPVFAAPRERNLTSISSAWRTPQTRISPFYRELNELPNPWIRVRNAS